MYVFLWDVIDKLQLMEEKEERRTTCNKITEYMKIKNFEGSW